MSIKEVLQDRVKMSRRMIKSLRWNGLTWLNGESAMLWYPLQEGDMLLIQLPEEITPDLHFPPDQQPLWQNEDLLVMSKKPEQVVHKTMNSALEDVCSLISDTPLHPVQRLDLGTSGLFIIALNAYAHHRLSQTPMEKYYLGIAHGRPTKETGLWEAPIDRRAPSIIERYVSPTGKSAKTLYKLLAYAAKPDLSLLKFKLITGRTHQIRVHCQHFGCPLLGDTLYGLQDNLDEMLSRQALHAAHLKFTLPRTEERIAVYDPLPPDMQNILHKFKFISQL